MSSAAVTVNVGGGPGGSTARTVDMSRWAERCIADEKPVIVFAQEVPNDDWLAIWKDAGYAVTDGVGPRWRIRSALVTRQDLDVTPLTEADCASLAYHGSYVAAARWNDAPRGPVILASVHASPQRADPEKYGWQAELPSVRNRLWDSDMVLSTLGSLARVPGSVGVLAAGDFNEARGYDLDDLGKTLGTWGQEYFAEVERLGFTDVTFTSWQEERPTRGRLQLDHVLPHGAAGITADQSSLPHTDLWWDDPGHRVLSDHAPLWFFLDA
jgi:hypothetical protein